MEIWEKVTWVMIGIGILFNMGAALLTIQALQMGFIEANEIMAIVHDIGPIAVFLTAGTAWLIMIGLQFWILKRIKMKKIPIWFAFITPSFMCILWGSDFLHDYLLINYGINEFTWINNLLIWNNYLN